MGRTQNNLGEAYRNRIRGEKAENIEAAIASYTAALTIYTPDAFPEIGLRRKIIWQLPTLTESGERKQRISKMRSHLSLLHYPSTPAKLFPNNGRRRKIIWQMPTVTESGERKQRIWNWRSHLTLLH
jgi:hypothetical protein